MRFGRQQRKRPASSKTIIGLAPDALQACSLPRTRRLRPTLRATGAKPARLTARSRCALHSAARVTSPPFALRSHRRHPARRAPIGRRPPACRLSRRAAASSSPNAHGQWACKMCICHTNGLALRRRPRLPRAFGTWVRDRKSTTSYQLSFSSSLAMKRGLTVACRLTSRRR